VCNILLHLQRCTNNILKIDSKAGFNTNTHAHVLLLQVILPGESWVCSPYDVLSVVGQLQKQSSANDDIVALMIHKDDAK